eukprot:CAMPEP_0197900820 /NCGR_PEP_ID=MMETSP1439-20131203/49998_1 /TAXON_ID=66791 /ORGANISM="Gonyaulax spinifera, Strain CCMP409" /LENGTH=242 /DNA_ID=CAMNT_0043521751 /DNA_START=48 /DNA_END=776 /DNA_ORIENTATION=+
MTSVAKEKEGGAKACMVSFLSHVPQLVVAWTLGCSAVMMKLMPFLGLWPDKMNTAIIASYEKQMALPQVKAVLGPLGVGVRGYMVTIIVLHLSSVALLLFRSARATKRVIGLWTMITMVYAEWVKRAIGLIKQADANSYQLLAWFFFGLWLLLLPPSSGILPALARALGCCRGPPRGAEEARGRPTTSSDKGRRGRDTTPVQKAKEEKPKEGEGAAEQSPGAEGARRRADPKARAAAAGKDK